MTRMYDKHETARRVNARRPLIRLSDCTGRGLAMKATRACSIEGCDRAHCARGLCKFHYQRQRLTGTTNLVVRPKRQRRGCVIPGCHDLHTAHGLCSKHLQRRQKHGDPTVVLPPHRQSWPDPSLHPSWRGPNAGYTAAHQRVTSLHGRARTHRCVDCGDGAAEWSYNYRDPEARVTLDGRPYSLNTEFYEPRCVPCHRSFDRKAQPPRAVPPCSVSDCGRLSRSLGLCPLHYRRWRLTGSVQLTPRSPRLCSVPGCGRRNLARDLCSRHYQQRKAAAKRGAVPAKPTPADRNSGWTQPALMGGESVASRE